MGRADELCLKWGMARGQLWRLGEHRLICGDCGDAATVAQVMAGDKADMVFTSPPYNKGSSSGGGFHAGGRSQQLTRGYVDYTDALPPEQYKAWQASLLRAWWGLLSENGAIFYNHRPRVQSKRLETALDWNPGLPVRQIVIWHSGRGINWSPCHYRGVHEWIVIFAKPGFSLLSRSHSGVGDVWSVGNALVEGHPAPFPVELPARALRTTAAQVVYEPFCGSGTTIMACEGMGRRCRAVEIAPAYVAVALERWAQCTGGRPELIGVRCEGAKSVVAV